MQGKEYFQNRRIADKISLVLKVVFVILAINNILFAALMITFGHLVFLIIPVLGLIIMPILGQQMVKALTDNILEPLEQIENAAEAMAHGNLDIDVTYEAEDELGKLAQSFRNTAASLKEVVEDIDQLLTEFAKGNFDAKSGNIEVYRGNFSEILSKLEETEKGLSQTISNVQESSNQVSAGADQLAQKDADCSVAMASGSDAASNVAQLVLLDSDFARMPSVVAEGRRVVNNIERTASLYIVKNIFSMLLAIFSVILMLDYPLEPSQVSLISMFTIGIPSFILALEPNKNPIRGRFLTNVLIKALPAGLTDFLVVSGLVLFCREFSVDLDCLSTSCTILVAIVGFMILYRIAKPMNIGHIIMMIGVVAGWLFCMLFVSKFFAITGISKQCAMLMVVFAIITEPALRYLSLIVEGMHDWGSRVMQKAKKA